MPGRASARKVSVGLKDGRPPRRDGAEGTRSHFRGGSAGFSVAARAFGDYAEALPDELALMREREDPMNTDSVVPGTFTLIPEATAA